jgi:glycosyltransferase involved in cell wall biosynthesis
MTNLSNISIGLIIPDFDFGGEEKRVVFFANNYLNSFKEVYVFSPDGKSSSLLDSRVNHVQINTRNYTNIFKILSLLKKKNITFLQGHKRASLPILVAAEKFLNIKCNFNFDNIYLNNGLSKYIMPKAIFYLSDVLKDHYKVQFTRHSNLVINMGGEFFDPISEEDINSHKQILGIQDKKVVLSLGRLSLQKNHKLLIEALLKVEYSNYIVLVVGEGPLEKDLKELCQTYGLNDKVKFLGHRKDINVLLSVSDFLVQSSIFEGFPNVFIEAASIGLPIVATNVGSSKTLVNDNGILVPSNNIESLANAIDTLCNEGKIYKENALMLSRSDYFKQFHKDNMLKNYLFYYQSE